VVNALQHDLLSSTRSAVIGSDDEPVFSMDVSSRFWSYSLKEGHGGASRMGYVCEVSFTAGGSLENEYSSEKFNGTMMTGDADLTSNPANTTAAGTVELLELY
jgi:hypothetical protein